MPFFKASAAKICHFLKNCIYYYYYYFFSISWLTELFVEPHLFQKKILNYTIKKTK